MYWMSCVALAHRVLSYLPSNKPWLKYLVFSSCGHEQCHKCSPPACIALGLGPGIYFGHLQLLLPSANCARYCGAKVDFVDIDPYTGLISLGALQDFTSCLEE